MVRLIPWFYQWEPCFQRIIIWFRSISIRLYDSEFYLLDLSPRNRQRPHAARCWCSWGWVQLIFCQLPKLSSACGSNCCRQSYPSGQALSRIGWGLVGFLPSCNLRISRPVNVVAGPCIEILTPKQKKAMSTTFYSEFLPKLASMELLGAITCAA